MTFWLFILIFSGFIIFYNYIGYALLILPFNYFKKKKPVNRPGENAAFLPSVTFIVPAFNEEYCIREKINNSLSQSYPEDRIEFIFITDGSTDNTSSIISEYPGVRLLHQPERNGKSAALNRAVSFARNEIIICSDTNTTLNADATRLIAQHYSSPRVGGVAGEKRVLAAGGNSDLEGEGLYWKYESFLKKTDSDFHSVVGAAGELFSVRRKLYENIPDNIILDDFYISLKIAEKGYRIIYEPGAMASELPSFSLEDELKRKIRIAAGGFQSIWLLRSLLQFWKHPKLSYLYISHRLLRWAVTPFCLIVFFIATMILTLETNRLVFNFLLISQVIFYTMAFIGSTVKSISQKVKIVKFAHYFTFMNIAVILGFFRYLRGRQSSSWEKVKRARAN